MKHCKYCHKLLLSIYAKNTNNNDMAHLTNNCTLIQMLWYKGYRLPANQHMNQGPDFQKILGRT